MRASRAMQSSLRSTQSKVAACAMTALLVLAACSIDPAVREAGGAVEIRFDASRRYQTIEGWGGGIPSWSESDPGRLRREVFEKHLPTLLDALTRDLGLNRFYSELYATDVEPVNDNEDAFHADMRGFHLNRLEELIRGVILPLRERVRARGDHFVFYIRGFAQRGRFDARPNVLDENPDEYAELALVVLEKFRGHGISADYWVIQNEPELTVKWEPGRLGIFTARLGKRLRAAGFATRVAGPETLAPDGVPKWLTAVAQTPGALEVLGVVTYHSYDYDPTRGEPPRLAARRAVAALARQLRLPVAQTEQGGGGRANPELWDGSRYEGALDIAESVWADLTAGNVSAWELHSIFGTRDVQRRWGGGPGTAGSSGAPADDMPSHYVALAHFTRYVRPGAVRVAAKLVSGAGGVSAAAFLSPAGKPVLVLMQRSSTPRTVRVSGLPAGEYALSLTTRSKRGEVSALTPVAAGGNLVFELPGESIATIWGQ